MNDVLNAGDRQPVSPNRLSIDVDLDVRFADDAVGEDGFRTDAIHLTQKPFELHPERLDRFEIRTVHLDAHWCSHAALKHDDTGVDRHQHRRAGQPRGARCLDDFLPNVTRGSDVVAPVANAIPVRVDSELCLVRHHRFEHRDGSRI